MTFVPTLISKIQYMLNVIRTKTHTHTYGRHHALLLLFYYSTRTQAPIMCGKQQQNANDKQKSTTTTKNKEYLKASLKLLRHTHTHAHWSKRCAYSDMRQCSRIKKNVYNRIQKQTSKYLLYMWSFVSGMRVYYAYYKSVWKRFMSLNTATLTIKQTTHILHDEWLKSSIAGQGYKILRSGYILHV